MNRSVCRSAVVAGIVALLGLAPSASVLADTVAAPVVDKAKPAEGPAITKDQALALIKRYFAVPEGPGQLEVTLDRQGPRMVWQLTYHIERSDGRGISYGMGEIDARTGMLMHFHIDGGDSAPIRTGPLGNAYTEPQARSWAWLLVKDLYPAESGALRPAPGQFPDFTYGFGGSMDDQYVFHWAPSHGDIPVEGHGVTVTIDKYTLAYTGVSASFPKLTFPDGKAAVTPAEALKAYRQRLQPRLAYMPDLEPYMYPYVQKPSEMKLVYRLETDGVVDAISGRFVGRSGQDRPTPAELEPVPALAGGAPAVTLPKLPLDADSATAFARELLGPPADAFLNIHESVFSQGENLIHLYWDNEQENGGLTLDSQTGAIHDMYRSRQQMTHFDAEQLTPPVPLMAEQQAKAKAAAIAVVQRYYGQLAADLRLEPQLDLLDSEFAPEVPFFFQRYVNGIPAGNDGVSVNIDPVSMAWSGMYMNWTSEAVFPQVAGVMTPAQAADKFFADKQPTLVYQTNVPADGLYYGPDGPYIAEQHPQKAKLVYQLGADLNFPGGDMLDARTGETVGYGVRTRSKSDGFARIPAGHWAEGELRYMLSQRVVRTEQLNPEAPLNRGDALQMLVIGQRGAHFYSGDRPAHSSYTDVKQGDSLYRVVQDGIRRGVLHPQGENPVFGAGQPITRAEFAVWLARTLKLDQLGRSGLVTSSTFTDLAALSAEERNAVAFLQALGIASGGETFRGSAQLTQAEAAAFTVRLLNHLSGNP